MTILISSKKSKVAHLSLDDTHPLCGTVLTDVVRGRSMGFVGASKKCQHCGSPSFIAYFDNLRRDHAYETDKNWNLTKRT
jgi:hypothetical protein